VEGKLIILLYVAAIAVASSQHFWRKEWWSGDHLAHDPTLPSSVPGGKREHIYVQNRRQKSFPV
jgi:hypothetical protein